MDALSTYPIYPSLRYMIIIFNKHLKIFIQISQTHLICMNICFDLASLMEIAIECNHDCFQDKNNCFYKIL